MCYTLSMNVNVQPDFLEREFLGDADPDSPKSMPDEVREYIRRGLTKQGITEEEIDAHFPVLKRT